jgi:hypothetical protein
MQALYLAPNAPSPPLLQTVPLHGLPLFVGDHLTTAEINGAHEQQGKKTTTMMDEATSRRGDNAGDDHQIKATIKYCTRKGV